MITSYEPYLQDRVQAHNTPGPAGILHKSHSCQISCSVPFDCHNSPIKKRKTLASLASKEPTDVGFFDGPTVLRLLFKYSPDLPMNQMEDIAEDIGYSFEYVINSYVQFRRDATYKNISPKMTPPIDVSSLPHLNYQMAECLLDWLLARKPKNRCLMTMLANP
jgi:hypothetical protein